MRRARIRTNAQSAQPKFITRKLISQKEGISKTGKPNIQYKYAYKYTSGQPTVSKDTAYAESLHIPNKIRNETLRIYPKGGRVLADYEDLKGRKIHKYSREEISRNVRNKYNQNRKFINNHPKIISHIKNDLKLNQAALILYIIYKTGLRIGSNTDTKAEIKAYGVSTLLNKHVKLLSNNRIKFDFIGKKGVRNTTIIQDPIIWNELGKIKTTNWSKPIFNVTGKKVRDYLNSIDNRFDIKDFRTLKAYQIAMEEISKRKGPAPDERSFKKWQREVAQKVADELGNTKGVALHDYIDPKIWGKWRKPEWKPWKSKYDSVE